MQPSKIKVESFILQNFCATGFNCQKRQENNKTFMIRMLIFAFFVEF